VHLHTGTPLRVTLHPETERVVLAVEGHNKVTVALFLDRPELVRLLEVATGTRDDLDAAIAALSDTEHDTEQSTEHGSDEDESGRTAAA
jgi:hypothetical protein